MKTKIRLMLLLVIFALLSLAAAVIFEWRNAIPLDVKASYVGGVSCIECHEEQAKLFHNSHHDLAMDVANQETVLAKFDGTKIEHYGVTSTVFKSGDKFMVNTEGPDGQLQDFEVTKVFGVFPLQQYMVELQDSPTQEAYGQYQVLRLSWDVENEKWFYLSPPDVDEKLDCTDPLHWTGIQQRWNTNCAACHSTDLRKNYDTTTNTYSTTFVDIDVNCESCHGPGSLHVEIATNRRFFWDRNHGYGLPDLKTSGNVPQIETCAPCHSRRSEFAASFKPGERFDNSFSCQLLSDRIYHDDGQIRDEDYVYGSFIQSKMFHQGIKCTDCHDPHSTKVKFNDNQLCTSCHQHPAGKYDSPSHHRHQPGSKGASCVECHMPQTTYMAIDQRRDHSLRVPRPDLSIKFGTPNACTSCHIEKAELPQDEKKNLNQYLDWIIAAENGNERVASALQNVNQQMADAFNEWYPDFQTNDKRSKYYEDLVVGKSNEPNSIPTLRSLATDRSAPAIFRASAIEAFSAGGAKAMIDTALSCLDDDDPKVIAAAVAQIDSNINQLLSNVIQGSDAVSNLAMVRKLVAATTPLLRHDSRRVRIEAARTLVNIPLHLRNRIGGIPNHSEFLAALSEFEQSLLLGNDMAANHMIRAGIFESNEQLNKAETAYRTAISVEPNFTGARSNLAALIENRIDGLRSQIISKPQSAANESLNQRVRKLHADAKRLRQEENQLLLAEVNRAGDLTEAHGLFYRYGLSCYLMGDRKTAEQYLLKAHEKSPNTPSYLLGLATFYNQKEEFVKAMSYIKLLLELDSENQTYRSLRDDVLNKLNFGAIAK